MNGISFAKLKFIEDIQIMQVGTAHNGPINIYRIK